MLGDVALLGSFSCGIDEKGRIILPSIFEPEKGDRVAICVDKNLPSVFNMRPLNILTNQISKLDELILTSSDDSIVDRALAMRKAICDSVLTQLKVDASRRVFLGNAVLEPLGISSNRLYALGEFDQIKFFPSLDFYQQYTGRSYVKEIGGRYE